MSSLTLELSNDKTSLQINLNEDKKLSQETLIDQIVENSNNQADAFKHMHFGLKILSFSGFFINAFFSSATILLLAEKLSFFSALKGLNAFNGQGGFLHDIVNFFPYVGKLKKDWIEDKPGRRNTMVIASLSIIFILYPLTIYLSNDFLKKAEKYEKYIIPLKSLVMIFQGLFFTLLAVLFGMAMNYFVNIILQRILKKEEYNLMKDQNKFSKPTLKEILVRIAFVCIGIAVSVVLPYLEPKILAQLSQSNPLRSYIGALLMSITILLGIQCLGLRVIIPMIKKLSLYLAYKKEGKGEKSKLSIILFSFIFYSSSITFFSISAYLSRSPLFSSPVLNNVISSTSSAFAIGFNILGCTFIFMMTMLLVDSRELTKKLLSDNKEDELDAHTSIKNNKIAGSILIVLPAVFVSCASIVLIYSKVKNLKYLDFILDKPYLAVAFSFILSAMIFSGISLYGKTQSVQNNVDLIKKFGGIEKIQEHVNIKQKKIDNIAQNTEEIKHDETSAIEKNPKEKISYESIINNIKLTLNVEGI